MYVSMLKNYLQYRGVRGCHDGQVRATRTQGLPGIKQEIKSTNAQTSSTDLETPSTDLKKSDQESSPEPDGPIVEPPRHSWIWGRKK